MTAKEFLKDHIYKNGETEHLPYSNAVIKIMKDYAKLKCEEQKEICFKSASEKICDEVTRYYDGDNILNMIRYASLPKF